MKEISIHNIPDELLIKMFKMVLLGYERDATFNTLFRDSRSRVKSVAVLLSLSRVCKTWKATIWGYPAFWTRADGYYSVLLTRIIARAGALPLSIFLTSETEGLPELLASHGSRIKRLDLTICEDAADIGHLSFVDGRRLECFTLNYERVEIGLQRASPFFLFGQAVVPLKALSICPFSGFFPSNHFPNLTHLHLVLRFAWSMSRNSQQLSSSFFALLSHTPMLEFLTVAGICSPLDGFAGQLTSPDMPIVLTHLRSLVFIHGHMQSIGTVLPLLSIPQTALVRLQGVYASTPTVLPLPQLSAVQSVDHLNIATERTCLQLVAQGPSSGLWVQGLIADDDDELRADKDVWSWRAWLSTLPEFVPLAQVTKLEIYVGPHHGILSTLLPHIVRVVELSLRLRREDEQRRGDPDGSLAHQTYRRLAAPDPLLCPDLQVLNIDVDGVSPDIVPDLYPEELQHMIVFRSDIGHPLYRVSIQPFADMDVVQAEVYQEVASRFNGVHAMYKEVEVRGPGVSTTLFDCNDTAWERWSIEGANQYWEVEWDKKVRYTRPWDYSA